MTDNNATKWLIYEPVKTTVTRIIPELAIEIGLNESIVLLQISFWLSISNNVREGKYWTYQTLRDMKKKAFPYWGIETIRRTLKSLASKGYIIIGNHNERKGDRTQWLALEPEKLSTLKSVIVLSADDYGLVSKWDNMSQNETSTSQNETTLPEITPETTQKENIGAVRRDPEFDIIAKVWNTNAGGWVSNLQGMLFSTKKVKGSWDKCKILPPATVSEIEQFAVYATKRAQDGKVPTMPDTIQRWFYDFRTEHEKHLAAATNIIQFDPEKWTVPELEGVS